MIEPTLATASPAQEEDVTTTLYRAVIGPVSNSYYLPIFTRFEAADHAGISWNTAAALSTLNWLAFRRLWGAALAYFGALVAIVLLVFGIGRLVFQLPDALVGALTLGFGVAAFVLPGLFGNAVFHTECRKRMSKALVAHSDVREACAQLTRQAGTLRGMHYQSAPNAEDKLVRCEHGAIWDAIVDLRPESPTFRQWLGVELSESNGRMLLVPKGFAHGFVTLTDDTAVSYQVSAFYSPASERGLRFDDPAFAIDWPVPITDLSDKDRSWPDFVAEGVSA
jgi:dTDP-4-dehydrorhamnose 3,5-epimerase